jgi:pimeloyl-ACP methyl ester carboxylesterase
MLKIAGYRVIAFLLFSLFGAFRLGMRAASPFICRDPAFPKMMDRDLSRTTLESFLISISTLRRTDLRPELNKIHVPVLGMFGDRDNIVSPRQWQPLIEGIPQAQVARFQKAGHFIMLDEPESFRNQLKNFLDQPTYSNP